MSPLGSATDVPSVERAQATTRMVFVDSRLSKDTPYIGTDNKQSMSKIVRYLCETGTPPVLMAMPEVNFNIVERQLHYREQMTECGHNPIILNPNLPDDTRSISIFEQYGMEQFMAVPDGNLPCGSTILCLNDRVAFGVLSAAAKRGLKVGKSPDSDLRVAGHDNQFFSEFTAPTLTTVGQDTQKIGLLGAQALLDPDNNADLLNNGCLLESKLIIRDSA